MAADQQEAVLKRAVQRGLDNYTLGNATFLAERLLAVRHCAEHVHLLATCYYRAGESRCVVHSDGCTPAPLSCTYSRFGSSTVF